jgi:hypothetical protein
MIATLRDFGVCSALPFAMRAHAGDTKMFLPGFVAPAK